MKVFGQDISIFTLIHWCVTVILTIITSTHIAGGNSLAIVSDVATIATDVAQVAASKE